MISTGFVLAILSIGVVPALIHCKREIVEDDEDILGDDTPAALDTGLPEETPAKPFIPVIQADAKVGIVGLPDSTTKPFADEFHDARNVDVISILGSRSDIMDPLQAHFVNGRMSVHAQSYITACNSDDGGEIENRINSVRAGCSTDTKPSDLSK